MSRSVTEITKEALQLPEPDQFKLARTLLENARLHGEPATSYIHDEEIERRIAAIDAGVAEGRLFADVLADVDAALRRK